MYKVNFVVDRFLSERHTDGVSQPPPQQQEPLVNGVKTKNHITGKYLVSDFVSYLPSAFA